MGLGMPDSKGSSGLGRARGCMKVENLRQLINVMLQPVGLRDTVRVELRDLPPPCGAVAADEETDLSASGNGGWWKRVVRGTSRYVDKFV